ncbi:MAG TPA: thermonuclease family protein [Stellaceae bacterium]|nr:thermonuclease family protein [Stellaceae bacterium]
MAPLVTLALAVGGAVHFHPPRATPVIAATIAVAAAPEEIPSTPKDQTPAPPTLPDLPEKEVTELQTHTIDEAGEPPLPPPFTAVDREGRPILREAGPPPPPSSYRPSSPGPRLGTRQAAVTSFTGAAEAASGNAIILEGRELTLFGIRPPEPGDHCVFADGTEVACGEMAQAALARRLGPGSSVSCRVPQGQGRGEAGAVCTDALGVDLGGFLVAEGLALADTKRSFDYSRLEAAAQFFRRGLWHNR